METIVWVATKAFVFFKGKILLLRESSKYKDGTNTAKYNTVGGRVEPGQRFDESLLREIKEETALEVTIGKPFYVGEWRPVVRGEQWQIVGTYFECFANTDKITISSDHDDFIWIDPKDYKNYPLADAPEAFEAYLNK